MRVHESNVLSSPSFTFLELFLEWNDWNKSTFSWYSNEMSSTCSCHGYTYTTFLWPISARLYYHFMKSWTCPGLIDWYDLSVMRDKLGLTAGFRIRTWGSPGKAQTRCWFPCWFLRWDVTQTGCDQWTGCESPNWAYSSNSIIVEDSALNCALVIDIFACVHLTCPGHRWFSPQRPGTFLLSCLGIGHVEKRLQSL